MKCLPRLHLLYKNRVQSVHFNIICLFVLLDLPVTVFVCCSQGWIHEKAKLIESTDELGNDLAGVMTLQRRLSTMERDLAAIQAKVSMGLFPAAAGTVLVTWRKYLVSSSYSCI